MNPPKERIANRQLFYFLFMMRTMIVMGTLPVLTAADALQDAWISSILSFFTAAILVVMIGALSIRFPDLTVVQYSQKLLGAWGGRIFSLLFILNYLHIASTDVRVYAEAIITGFLPNTPLIFIISVMVVVAGLAAHAGVEVIGRAADLLFPFFVLMIVLALIFPLPGGRFLLANLEPIMSRGVAPVLRGALVPTLIIAQYLSLLMLTPTTTQPVKALKTALYALAASSLVLTLVAGSVIVMLGPDRGSRSTFPFFAMVRTLQISEFVERVEILTVFSWGFGLFIGCLPAGGHLGPVSGSRAQYLSPADRAHHGDLCGARYAVLSGHVANSDLLQPSGYSTHPDLCYRRSHGNPVAGLPVSTFAGEGIG